MPRAGRVDRKVARHEQDGGLVTIDQFLMRRDGSVHADNQFVARWMHFPTVPVGVEPIETDEAALAAIASA